MKRRRPDAKKKTMGKRTGELTHVASAITRTRSDLISLRTPGLSTSDNAIIGGGSGGTGTGTGGSPGLSTPGNVIIGGGSGGTGTGTGG